MHVRIEETGNHRPASEIDSASVGAELNRLSDVDDAAVPDRQGRRNHASAIDESAVHEREIAGPVSLRSLGCGPAREGVCRDRRRPGRRTNEQLSSRQIPAQSAIVH